MNETLDDNDKGGCVNTDRISNLPDSILCHILSFLPTKYAVATSILSSKWKNLFPSIPNLRLRLDDSLFLRPESVSDTYLIRFMNFVDRLFNITLRDVPCIHAFHLSCERYDDGRHISNWVRAALHLNVKKVHLQIHSSRNSNLLVDSLFGCKIECLNLTFDFIQHVPECRFSLPNLKMLVVQGMKFNSVNKIYAGCPLLECLVINKCTCYPGQTIRICIPMLKVLVLFSNFCHQKFDLELDTPKLERLHYRGSMADCFLVNNLNSLHMAYLDLGRNRHQNPYDFSQHAAEFIKACVNVEKLYLSENIITMLQHFPRPMPQFRNLLFLTIRIDTFGWKFLRSLLDCAPGLKNVFIIEGFNEECYEKFKSSLPESMLRLLVTRSGKSYFWSSN
ncbi:F-box/LRR-repeat protein [Abeliophyllum distichum]|uniref:F-box/LRR-repeat protein n=1 Tax=Abeliophyllum distichum TaxID=126358 RepID=A0ABD1RYD9_9LAMI